MNQPCGEIPVGGRRYQHQRQIDAAGNKERPPAEPVHAVPDAGFRDGLGSADTVAPVGGDEAKDQRNGEEEEDYGWYKKRMSAHILALIHSPLKLISQENHGPGYYFLSDLTLCCSLILSLNFILKVCNFLLNSYNWLS